MNIYTDLCDVTMNEIEKQMYIIYMALILDNMTVIFPLRSHMNKWTKAIADSNSDMILMKP